MNSKSDHHNKKGPPKGGENARRHPPATAGGGAILIGTEHRNKKIVCDGRSTCDRYHCPRRFNGEGHGNGYVEPSTCWKLTHIGHCSICSTGKQGSSLVEDFPALANSGVVKSVKDSTTPDVSSTTGSLVQSGKVSTGEPQNFATVVAKSGPAIPSSQPAGIKELYSTIQELTSLKSDLNFDESSVIMRWIELLTSMIQMPNIYNLSSNVRITIDAALSFCQIHCQQCKQRDTDEKNAKLEGDRIKLYDQSMFRIQHTSSQSMSSCISHAYVWSLFYGSNYELLKRFSLSLVPITNVDSEKIITEFLECFSGSFDERIIENLKNIAYSFKSVQDFRTFVHEMKRMLHDVVSEADDVVSEADDVFQERPSDKPEQNQDQKYIFLVSFMNHISNYGFDLESINDEITILELYQKVIEFSHKFDTFFSIFESLFFNVEKSESFFTLLIRGMTATLANNDLHSLPEFKNELLKGNNHTEDFYTKHLFPLLQKVFNRTTKHLLRTDRAVLDSVKTFCDLKESFLSDELVKFIFSTFNTGGNEGFLTIAKALDNYLTVLMLYFGISENPRDCPFGHRWFMNYTDPSGSKVHDNVSDIVGNYILKLICVAKVLVDKNKELSIPFGNCGVKSNRGENRVVDVSISYIFDQIGKNILDDQKFGYDAATNKPPNVFDPKIMNKTRSNDRTNLIQHFLNNSIQIIANQCFSSGKKERESFISEVEKVENKFRISPDNDELLHFFLSMFKRNANDKLQMCLIEFLLHEPCKNAFLDGLSFLNLSDVNDRMRSLVSNIMRFGTNVDPSQDGDVIKGIHEALHLVIQSGVSLDEVLHVCAIFKSLYIENKQTMVFINTFGVALMVAASKSLGLKFSTMYNIIVDKMNPKRGVVKNQKDFQKNLQKDIAQMMRFYPRFFNECKKTSPDCIEFCSDATSSYNEDEGSIHTFIELVNNICPVYMLSPAFHKGQRNSELNFSLSETLDRVVLVLLTSNRVEILDQLGLIENDPFHMKFEKKDSDREKDFFNSVKPSIMTSTLSSYIDSLKKYMGENQMTIAQLLNESDVKALRASFRMEVQLKSLYDFLLNAGVLTTEIVDLLNSEPVRPHIFKQNWKGNPAVDIDALATVISQQNKRASETFVKGIFSMIHQALYPNHKDLLACRKLLDDLYRSRNDFLESQCSERMYMTSSSDHHNSSLADVAFESFDRTQVNKAFVDFMKSINPSMRDTIKNRIDNLPVTLMSKKFQKGLSMAKPECCHTFMTECAMIMYDEDPERFVHEYFSSLKSYVETALYDDQENGINLETFREELLNSSTKLGQAFTEYVKVSIDIFETE